MGGKIKVFEKGDIDKVDIIIDVLLGIGIIIMIWNEFVDIIDVVNSVVFFVVSIDVFFGLDVNIG